MRIFVPEGDARDMQPTIADVADRDRSLDPAAGFHAAEEGRTGNYQTTGRRVAENMYTLGPGWIVADNGNRRGLRTDTRWLKAHRQFNRHAGRNMQWIATHTGRDEVRR
jgi:hypothetical protein